jgi:DNA end-binding protein Ku
MLGPEGEPLARRYFSQKSGNDLEDEDMVRGFEYDKDRYVIVTDEELERLAPEQSRDIDLRRFVPLADIPPLYFDRSYFLAPSEGSEKAYRLLAQTMDKEELAGVATFVMRGKEYLVAIFPENEILRAETMRFADEIRSPKEIGLPEKKKVPAATVKKFENLIAKHSGKRLSLNELKDEQTEKLLKLVEKKRKGHKDIVEVEVAEREPGKVVDLMAALKKSLAGKRKAA